MRTASHSFSAAAAAHVARVARAPARALWDQVCIAVRIELTAGISNAMRELLAPCGDTLAHVPGSDRHAAARLLEVAGVQLANPVDAARGPVRLAPGAVSGNLALVVDAVASDRAVVSTWRPREPQSGSVVLAQAGLKSALPATGLLDACGRWLERLTAVASDLASEPFEARVLAWPVAASAGGAHRIIERYIAGGPGAPEHARAMAAQRQAQIDAARAQRSTVGAFAIGSSGSQALHQFLGDRAQAQALHGLQEGDEMTEEAPQRAVA